MACLTQEYPLCTIDFDSVSGVELHCSEMLASDLSVLDRSANLSIWFDTIHQLVMCHSPSGMESEVDRWIVDYLTNLPNVQSENIWQDSSSNIVVKIFGRDSSKSVAITAHKDEIGAIVKEVEGDGQIAVRRLGGSYPWVYGEGAMDILGDRQTVQGVLSFGSRHVSHESPQKAQQEDRPVSWSDAWVDTKLSVSELDNAGVRPGTRVVVGKHRKAPVRLGDFIGSYTLDNKASVAILLAIAARLTEPAIDTYLVFSAKEEVGALGALYFSQQQKLDAMIALEICPVSSEYPIDHNEVPVLLSQDAYGLYDEPLNASIRAVAQAQDIPLQLAILQGFGSDASIAMKFGHVPKAACLSFPTENTHGFEIAHLGAISACANVLVALCKNYAY